MKLSRTVAGTMMVVIRDGPESRMWKTRPYPKGQALCICDAVPDSDGGCPQVCGDRACKNCRYFQSGQRDLNARSSTKSGTKLGCSSRPASPGRCRASLQQSEIFMSNIPVNR